MNLTRYSGYHIDEDPKGDLVSYGDYEDSIKSLAILVEWFLKSVPREKVIKKVKKTSMLASRMN